MINRCYDCGFQWEADDLNEPCPNCNGQDSDNFNNGQVGLRQYDLKDEDSEATITEIVDEKMKQEIE